MLSRLKVFTRFEFFVARKYIKATSRGRLSFLTTFSIIAIFLGVSTLILVVGFMSGFQDEVRNRLLYLQPHVDIRKYPNGTIYDYHEIISKIARKKGVKSISPYIEAKCIIRKGENWDAVMLKGVPPESHELNILSRHMIKGRIDLTGKNLLISSYLSQVLGVSEGDTVQLYTIVETGAPPPFDFSVEKARFVVSGIFSENVSFNASMLAYINIAEAQKFLQTGDGVTGLQIWLQNPYRAPQFVREIEAKGIITFPIFALDWTNMFKTFFSALKLEKLAMFLVMTLMVIIASFSIIATLSILILQKTREIGILRSLGVTSRGIMRIFMLVGTMIGATGAILGGVVSVAIGMLIEKYHIVHLPPDIYMIDYLPFKLSWGSSILIVVVTFLIVVMSTLYPSIRASRLTPVEAIRHE